MQFSGPTPLLPSLSDHPFDQILAAVGGLGPATLDAAVRGAGRYDLLSLVGMLALCHRLAPYLHWGWLLVGFLLGMYLLAAAPWRILGGCWHEIGEREVELVAARAGAGWVCEDDYWRRSMVVGVLGFRLAEGDRLTHPAHRVLLLDGRQLPLDSNLYQEYAEDLVRFFGPESFGRKTSPEEVARVQGHGDLEWLAVAFPEWNTMSEAPGARYFLVEILDGAEVVLRWCAPLPAPVPAWQAPEDAPSPEPLPAETEGPTTVFRYLRALETVLGVEHSAGLSERQALARAAQAPEERLAVLRGLLAEDSEDPRVREALGFQLYALERWSEAREVYLGLREDGQAPPLYTLMLGCIADEAGDPVTARVEYAEAVKASLPEKVERALVERLVTLDAQG